MQDQTNPNTQETNYFDSFFVSTLFAIVIMALCAKAIYEIIIF